MTDNRERLVELAEDWRAGALAWVGRRVRIVEGPSTEHGTCEIGTVICVDATDYRPSAWVKVEEVHGSGFRSEYPSYRSCDLCWLVDMETGDGGPVWCSSPQSDGHGERDSALVLDRIRCVGTARSQQSDSRA
jgi:hypothetical protein